MSFDRLIPQQRKSPITQDMRKCFLLRLKSVFLIFSNSHQYALIDSLELQHITNLWFKKVYETTILVTVLGQI